MCNLADVYIAPSPWLVALGYGAVFGTLILLWCTLAGRVLLRRNNAREPNARVELLELRDSDDLVYDPLTGFRKPKK